MKSIFLICTFLLSGLFLHAQKLTVNVSYQPPVSNSRGDTIYYLPGVKLKWSDFRGKPNLQSVAGAVTASGINMNADMKSRGNEIMLNIRVFAYFTKHSSWKKPHTDGDYHLTHEQNHFNITYLGAIDLVERLKKAHITFQNYNDVIDSIFNEANNENDALQNRYDSETRYSIDTTQQQEWNKKINQMLKNASADILP